MAVARLTLDPSDLRALAEVAGHLGEVRLRRELGRAADRPGRTAEITAREVRTLLGADTPSRSAEAAVAAAYRAILGSEERERDRPRGALRVRQLSHPHYPTGPPTASSEE